MESLKFLFALFFKLIFNKNFKIQFINFKAKFALIMINVLICFDIFVK